MCVLGRAFYLFKIATKCFGLRCTPLYLVEVRSPKSETNSSFETRSFTPSTALRAGSLRITVMRWIPVSCSEPGTCCVGIRIISRFFDFVLGNKDLGRLFVGFLWALAAVFLIFLLTAGDCYGYNDAFMEHIPSSLRNIISESVRDRLIYGRL